MTPLELSYPLTGLVLALGSGVYVWQSRRSLEKSLAQSQNSDPGQVVANTPETPTHRAATLGESSADVAELQLSQDTVHIKGKLRRLEKDLEQAQVNLKNALAERDEFSKNYQSQEKMLVALQQQLAHYDDDQSEKFTGLQKLNQELLQENTNLSDRLKQAVNEVAETRPKLVRMQTLETRNSQLTDQLNHVEQNQQKAIASRLEAHQQAWQAKEQQLKSQITEWEERVQGLTSERDQARQSLQNLTDQNQSLQAELQALQASLELLTQAEKQWQGEKEKLGANLSQLEDGQKALALANAELKLKLETTKTEGDRLKAEKKEQTTALQSAQGEIAKLQQQLADLEKVQVSVKSEQLPPVKPVVEPEPVKAVTVVTPPQQESVVETQSVAGEVSQPKKLPVVEAKPTEVKVQPEEKLAKSPAKIEPSQKVVESPALVEEEQIKPEEIPPAAVIPERLPENAAETVETGATTGDHALAGKKVVILGTLNAMNREEAKTRLQDIGAECTSAPSGKTDYIVVGKAPGAKLKKAQKLGVHQLSEAQFLELLEN